MKSLGPFFVGAPTVVDIELFGATSISNGREVMKHTEQLVFGFSMHEITVVNKLLRNKTDDDENCQTMLCTELPELFK